MAKEINSAALCSLPALIEELMDGVDCVGLVVYLNIFFFLIFLKLRDAGGLINLFHLKQYFENFGVIVTHTVDQ